jgi:hypothetical protein
MARRSHGPRSLINLQVIATSDDGTSISTAQWQHRLGFRRDVILTMIPINDENLTSYRRMRTNRRRLQEIEENQNVQNVFHHFRTNTHIYIVSERWRIDLNGLVQPGYSATRHESITPQEVCRQVLNGINSFHLNGMLHGLLNSANIRFRRVANRYQVRIANQMHSREMSDDMQTRRQEINAEIAQVGDTLTRYLNRIPEGVRQANYENLHRLAALMNLPNAIPNPTVEIFGQSPAVYDEHRALAFLFTLRMWIRANGFFRAALNRYDTNRYSRWHERIENQITRRQLTDGCENNFTGLIRCMRNTAAHYEDQPPMIRQLLGTPPVDYMRSWYQILGNLTVLCDAWFVALNLDDEDLQMQLIDFIETNRQE